MFMDINQFIIKKGGDGLEQLFYGNNRKKLLYKRGFIKKVIDLKNQNGGSNPGEINPINTLIDLDTSGYISVDESKDIQFLMDENYELSVDGADTDTIKFELDDNGMLSVSI